MDISFIAEAATVATTRGVGFAKLLIDRQIITSSSALAVSDSLSDKSPAVLQTSSAILDALAPPPVKSSSCKTIRRTNLRKKRRTKQRSYTGGDSEDGGEDYWIFGGDGPFGGAGGNWGGGKGWNFGGFGGQNWDESSGSSSSSDFAFGFVYEVLYWIALSNCVHFAFKRLVRIVAGGFSDPEREKVPLRLTPVC